MSLILKNHTGNISILYHKHLPLIRTGEFDFFRCVEFNNSMYGKTVSELHAGNLRLSRTDNRYSNLFPGQKLSYWADSPETAKAEIKHWGAKNNIITFWSYDDGSSFCPTVFPKKELEIIDGTKLGFNDILKKLERKEQLKEYEKDLIVQIAEEEPDCLLYESEARKGSYNYLFFEHGFKKLSLREVRLNLNENKSKNHNTIACAISCDYSPILESYGNMFLPIAKIGKDRNYCKSDEFSLRRDVMIYNIQDICEKVKKQHDKT